MHYIYHFLIKNYRNYYNETKIKLTAEIHKNLIETVAEGNKWNMKCKML